MKTSYTQKCIILYGGIRYENEYFPSKKKYCQSDLSFEVCRKLYAHVRLFNTKNNLLRIAPMSFFFGKDPCALIFLMAF